MGNAAKILIILQIQFRTPECLIEFVMRSINSITRSINLIKEIITKSEVQL